MTEDKDKLMNLLAINVEIGWKCDFICEDCYRFFDCPSPRRLDFYERGRFRSVLDNMRNVGNIIPVMSGKGGVGKSIISANLAVALAKKGYSVAIIDSDLHGPSITSILGVRKGRLVDSPGGIIPPKGPLGIKIVSTSFLFEDDTPVTWLSDKKRGALELFLANVNYGYTDYLIIDMPPGTGSESVNLFKYLPQISGAIMITIPSDMAGHVVRRGITLCRKTRIPIIGLIENMSGFICPNCGKSYMVEFGSGNALAEELGIPLLGKIGHDPLIVNAADRGNSFLLEYPDSDASKNFIDIISMIEKKTGGKGQKGKKESPEEEPEGRQMDIIQINVGRSCYRKSCYGCNDYFQCTYPQKDDRRFIDKSLQVIKKAMSGIKHKIAVMSCKGGVGKSTFSANLAAALALRGKKVTVLDCDLHGPCIPRLLGVEGKRLKLGSNGMVPILGTENVGVISMAFLLQTGEAITWFDSLKKTTIEQFLNNVDYGNLDYLIVDLPPGTGAESYGLLQYTPDLDGTLIITLPSESPQVVARKSISLCRQADAPVLGIVENMSRFVCPDCNNIFRMCGSRETRDIAQEVGVPFLGDIPLDNRIYEDCVNGEPFIVKYPESSASQSLFAIVDKLQEAVGDDEGLL
ncbi:MAG: P-loop NTPase [Deltaproteobacteria bacterium]|nr:P-loop NTPase [Deltaproteobacteria bacterium]